MGRWHTIRALESGSVILEKKDEPYAPMSQEDVFEILSKFAPMGKEDVWEE